MRHGSSNRSRIIQSEMLRLSTMELLPEGEMLIDDLHESLSILVAILMGEWIPWMSNLSASIVAVGVGGVISHTPALDGVEVDYWLIDLTWDTPYTLIEEHLHEAMVAVLNATPILSTYAKVRTSISTETPVFLDGKLSFRFGSPVEHSFYEDNITRSRRLAGMDTFHGALSAIFSDMMFMVGQKQRVPETALRVHREGSVDACTGMK